jgi:hypothetical protein
MNIGRSEYTRLKEKEKALIKSEKLLQEIKLYAESMNWKKIVRKVDEFQQEVHV